MKTFLLDTNVLLHDPTCLSVFGNNKVVIPISVLDELDKHKSRPDDVGRNARTIARTLDALRKDGCLSDGVKVGDTIVQVELNHSNFVPEALDASKVDNKILSTALGLMSDGENIIVVTKDINLRVKCDALKIIAEDYEKDKVAKELDSIYSGIKTTYASSEAINSLYLSGKVALNIEANLNQYFVVKSFDNESQSALVRYIGACDFALCKDSKKDIYGIHAKNVEQRAALDMLMNPDIQLVTIIGKAGSGKTLISLAAALQQVFQKNIYQRILISRPIQPMGKDIGFLPGPQPLDAKILTPDGWTTMGQLVKGQYIFGRNGKPTKILDIFPKGIKDVYSVKTLEGETECCEDHLWLTQNAEERKRKKMGKIRSTKEIMECIVDKKGKLNYSLPRNEVVLFNKKELPISPYVLGVIIGDGCCAKRHVSFSSKDEEIIDKVNNDVRYLGCQTVNHKNSISYNLKRINSEGGNKVSRIVKITNINGEIKEYDSIWSASKELNVHRSTINDRCRHNRTINGNHYEFTRNDKLSLNPVMDALKVIGLNNKRSYEKFIPDIYKFTSVEDRIELLRGLMDTDGSIRKSDGELVFSTVSKKLAYDFVEIIKSLGGIAKIHTCDRQIKQICGKILKNTHLCYTINISLNINPFNLSRKSDFFKIKNERQTFNKIESIDYVGKKEVQCILVEDDEHLYITDDYIVTHNTIEDKLNPWMQPVYDNLELLMGLDYQMLSTYKEEGTIQVEPLTYIRGRSIPNSFMLIDESQNLSLAEIKTIITRMGENSKIVLTGDVEQIDALHLDFSNNGLSHVVEKFKEYDISGHITLRKGERSKLATLASEIL